MSQYFSIDGTDVWNPSNGPGTLFVHLAAAFEPLAGAAGTSCRDLSGGSPAGPDRLAELVAGCERAMPA